MRDVQHALGDAAEEEGADLAPAPAADDDRSAPKSLAAWTISSAGEPVRISVSTCAAPPPSASTACAMAFFAEASAALVDAIPRFLRDAGHRGLAEVGRTRDRPDDRQHRHALHRLRVDERAGEAGGRQRLLRAVGREENMHFRSPFLASWRLIHYDMRKNEYEQLGNSL